MSFSGASHVQFPASIGGWRWFQMPVAASDLVPIMYRQGLSRDACVHRLRHRFLPTEVNRVWIATHKAAGQRDAVIAASRIVVEKPAPKPIELYAVAQTAPPSVPMQEGREAAVARRIIQVEAAECRRAYRDQRASLLHLLDLKRAGHSPTRTESNIPPDSDRPLRVTRAADISSYFGSSAALCAELG